MCSRPQIKDGKTFACRSCDECIASRRAGWVARCMAETTQWKHAVCVSLTYDDNAPGGYDAARFFAYVDVRLFIQRITAALRRINKSLCVRFICAGEQGDRNGRCHWHLILWSDYDLRTLGEVTIRGSLITNPEDMMTKGKRKRRLHWSLWAVDGHPLGFVTFGAADQSGASYVVSYCLKDQFTAEKSKGTGREAKSENFATGLFRMSKRPAIGERWLIQKLSRLEAAQAVLANTMLSIPGYSWEWYPTGTLREKLLVGLRAINEKRNEAGLGDAPQWPGLLASCKDNPKDMEILNGQVLEIAEEDFRENFRAKEIDAAFRARPRLARYEQEWRTLCYICLINAESDKLYADGIGSWQEEGWFVFYDQASGVRALSKDGIRAKGGQGCVCEWCGRKDYLRAFLRSGKAAP